MDGYWDGSWFRLPQYDILYNVGPPNVTKRYKLVYKPHQL